MNDLFSTFNRYNGDLSLSQKLLWNSLHMLFWFLPLCSLGLFRGFTFWHEHAFTFPPPLAHSAMLSLCTFPFSPSCSVNALTISICPLQVQATESLSVMFFFLFSFLLFPTFGAVVLWPPHPQLWNPADLRICIILVALLKLLVHLTCKVLLPAFYWIYICLFFFLQQCACI